MDKRINSGMQFHNLMQWLGRNEEIKKNAYTLKAFVSYETDNEDLSFYNEKTFNNYYN